jgi:DASS family divalent anion:Na+ symporter
MNLVKNSIAEKSQSNQTTPPQRWAGAKLMPSLIVIVVFIALSLIPVPEGLSPKAWSLFNIFICTILAIVLKPLPMGAVALLSLAACTLTKTLTIEESLTSFSSHMIWLVLISFLLARGFIKTGLGTRIAYHFVYFFGKSTLGLGYGLVLTETLLSPFIPSTTARGAGIIFPIVLSLSKEFGSDPANNTQRKVGAFLMAVCFHTNVITSTLFLTAMAANPIIAGFALEFGVEMTWINWAKATLVPGILSLIAMPLIVYFTYPPEIKQTPTAKEFAQRKLAELGKFSFNEMVMLSTFGMLLVLWVFGSYLNINATVAALAGLSVLLLTGVLDWEDVLNEKNGWNTFIWLTILLNLSNYLAKFGLMVWFGGKMQTIVSVYSWPTALAALLLVYYYSHYFFASLTAHITSLYSAMTVVAIACGAPGELVAYLFAFFSSLCAAFTHYGTGAAPVYYGTNYIPFAVWWKIGAILGFAYLIIWGVIGSAWLNILGMW